MGELVAVRVPEPHEEAARDLVRAREDTRGDLMRARHRLSKLLLRRGLVYEGSAWTLAHDAWLRRQRFDSRPLSLAFDECYGRCCRQRLGGTRSTRRSRSWQRQRRSPRPLAALLLAWRLDVDGVRVDGRARRLDAVPAAIVAPFLG